MACTCSNTQDCTTCNQGKCTCDVCSCTNCPRKAHAASCKCQGAGEGCACEGKACQC
ncbi:hypothetical protein FA10DRAFT_269211 [Acaromyces ingoldii]|uniref:Metallothionein n=1 Tax=Acaromyces ingoldii TaxID=215250 RepID=A0A316YJP2_9BASI|nr:hypothetical protein FA10DRAFT_269211 [Acaromyces ingoldii]PWN87945.1 hypothetical protein FA10DRAFT_269211 [Acaromyces ingoldii]